MFQLTTSYFSVIERQNNSVLISTTKDEIENSLHESLKLSTGGIGVPSLNTTLSSINRYNGKGKVQELSDFIISLNAKTIFIHSQTYFSSIEALFIFIIRCKKLNILTVVYAAKPFEFVGKLRINRFLTAMEQIKNIADEYYVVTDNDLMNEGDKSLRISEYTLKFESMIAEYVYEKFYEKSR